MSIIGWPRPATWAGVMMGLSGIMAVFAAYMAAYAEELMPDRCLVGFDHYEPELGWLFLTLPLYILLSAVFAVLWREGPEMGRGAAITTAATARSTAAPLQSPRRSHAIHVVTDARPKPRDNSRHVAFEEPPTCHSGCTRAASATRALDLGRLT